jgi:hypothetical protein
MKSKTLPMADRAFPPKPWLAVAAILVAGACTKANPDYCSTSMDCSNGDLCDVSTHACVSEPVLDAATNPPDSAPPACDVNKPFGAAAEVAGLRDSMANDVHATLTADERTIYFATNRFNYTAVMRIYKAERATRDVAFEAPTQVVSLTNANDVDGERNPAISADGNTIVFDVTRTSANLLLMSTRSDPTGGFPAPVTLTDHALSEATVTADGKTIYANNQETGYLARFQSVNGTFGAYQPADVQTGFTQLSPATSDDLTLFMTFQMGAVYASKRTSKTQQWPTPVEVTELNSHDGQLLPSWVSPDGCRLYMTYAPVGTKSRIYMAKRPM